MKRLIALICLLVAPAGATVLVDSTTPSGYPSAGVMSWNMTIGTGINRAVIVACETNAVPPPAISSVTVGASTLTFVTATRGSLDGAEIWIATGIASGSQAIKAYGHAGTAGCGSVSFENVDQTTPIDISTGGVNVTSVTWTTTVSTTLLVDVIGQGTTNQVSTPGIGQTLQWYNPEPSQAGAQQGSTKLGGLAGPQVMQWTTPTILGAIAATTLRSAPGAPDISTLSPHTAAIGTGAFTLTVNGQNFVSGATVTWNGSNRVTTFVSATQLTAAIPATDVVTISQVNVRVINPDNSRTANVIFPVTGDITFTWATDGGYKPDENTLYGTLNSTTVTNTRIWNGNTIQPFQAKNEINGFAFVMENGSVVASTAVSVSYPVLTGPNGYVISSTPAATSRLWDWTQRPIELYYVRYLPINGMSTIEWEDYDEQHVPERFQATYTINGSGQGIRSGGWTSRPDHDKYYPEILVPMEAVVGSTFTVNASSSQIVWMDIYVPKQAPAGLYTGTITVYEGPQISTQIPITLTVYPFTMPDTPPSKPFAFLSVPNVNNRQGGIAYPQYAGITSTNTISRLHYYQELHRHGLTPVGDAQQGGCDTLIENGPCPEFQMQLDGSLYTATNGYGMAPGIATGEPLYSMFNYTAWKNTPYWQTTSSSTCTNANIWVTWFQQHAPNAEFFWYLEDEAASQADNNMYAGWVSTCTPPGNLLHTFATTNPAIGQSSAPIITDVATTQELGIALTEENGLHYYNTNTKRRVSYYNGARPWNGTLVTDDDGVAPRVMSWLQYKKKFDHYYIWETTNYTSGADQDNDLFHDAKTFGYWTSTSTVYGRTGFNYNNGDGVWLYPGNDQVKIADNYGVDVPFPSWRMNMFRRGINDFTYLTLAAQYDPVAVNNIVNQMIPKVLWEYGVVDPTDPTYQYGPKSWTSDPNVWEQAREKLAQIIANHR